MNGRYLQHKGSPFKVARGYRWMVVVSGLQFVEDVRKASNDELSLAEASNDTMNLEYTLGQDAHHNPYHIVIIGSQLTRNLGILYPDIIDEIVTAFEEILGLQGNGELEFVVTVYRRSRLSQNIVSRTSNRIFIGLPLGRDPDRIDLTMRFTLDNIKGGVTMRLFPSFGAVSHSYMFSIQPLPFYSLVARFTTSVPASTRCGIKLLGPIIEERRKYLDAYGKDCADKPNGFLSWLMDHPEASESSVKDLTLRLLSINFAAIYVGLALQSFPQALYILAGNLQYMQPLRACTCVILGIQAHHILCRTQVVVH
ncbi:hypothetical protein PAXINDRAFT_80343 [Paxillus involutus ATCC 200175]|uniref:Uncharacterized protein n=1 Tax=Paxillus involutus ATCC 200175 TaxID=664439 RepID=A0A0C9SWC8_PAXIN|nr:hypothetical protein PAXINDRAFT_80343 [Paxillus involutus ATCC 200175]